MINVIGIGQNINTMTLEAFEAIKNSDIVIGYKKYIDEISELIEDKEIIQKGMGDEIKRVEMAISKSIEGKSVALISSGDPGVFGMSNVLFQILSKYEEDIDVKVCSGVSAANYSANLLGAPLNDYSVISLSNVLTPLSEIEKKIEFSLKANLILAIYNPISKTRKEPFRRFKKLILDIKGENVLIGIVNSEKYPSKVTIVKVKNLKEEDVNMSTTLIVGNDLTYEIDNHMVTPRGYVVKSDLHPLALDFYEKFLEGETPEGPNPGCEFYPCHYEGQSCDFCYCPFYPCGDSSTGGSWIKNKGVWNCKECLWIHDKDTIKCVKEPLKKLLNSPESLKTDKKQLLKLRRACLLGNDPNDL